MSEGFGRLQATLQSGPIGVLRGRSAVSLAADLCRPGTDVKVQSSGEHYCMRSWTPKSSRNPTPTGPRTKLLRTRPPRRRAIRLAMTPPIAQRLSTFWEPWPTAS